MNIENKQNFTKKYSFKWFLVFAFILLAFTLLLKPLEVISYTLSQPDFLVFVFILIFFVFGIIQKKKADSFNLLIIYSLLLALIPFPVLGLVKAFVLQYNGPLFVFQSTGPLLVMFIISLLNVAVAAVGFKSEPMIFQERKKGIYFLLEIFVLLSLFIMPFFTPIYALNIIFPPFLSGAIRLYLIFIVFFAILGGMHFGKMLSRILLTIILAVIIIFSIWVWAMSQL